MNLRVKLSTSCNAGCKRWSRLGPHPRFYAFQILKRFKINLRSTQKWATYFLSERGGMQQKSPHYYRIWLMEELAERTRRNAHYSLTAFAKQLDISAPTLSQVILGKRPLTRKTALKIVGNCSFTPDQRNSFLSSILNFRSPLPLQGASARQTYQDLEPEIFQMISKWYHYAILSLGDIKPNFADSKWISERLGITEREASDAFDRLLRLNLIHKKQKGFSQASSPLWMPTAQPSANTIRQSHLQNLKKAEQALYDDTTKLELYSTLTVAVNERYLPDVRVAISKFRESIREIVDRGSRGRVYTLAVQMFPISKP